MACRGIYALKENCTAQKGELKRVLPSFLTTRLILNNNPMSSDQATEEWAANPFEEMDFAPNPEKDAAVSEAAEAAGETIHIQASVTGDAITVTLPDGCYIRYDKVKCELEMKGTRSSIISSQIPPAPAGRPKPWPSPLNGHHSPAPSAMAREGGASTFTSRKGALTKLGGKKGVLGESWKRRHFVLKDDTLSYHDKEGAQAIRSLTLTSDCTVKKVKATDPARSDRFELPNSNKVSRQALKARATEFDGTVGRDKCLELRFPTTDTAVGRTYYLSAESEADLQAWIDSIADNLAVLQSRVVGGEAKEVQLKMLEVGGDGSKTLAFYRSALQTSISEEILWAHVERFYTLLIAGGVVV